jgi:flagellar export protein FliJ
MKRFRFSLETVHNLRELRRDEAERQLAQAAAVVMTAATAVEEIQHRRAAIEAKLVAGSTGDLCAAEIAMQVNYLAALAQREVEAREQLAALERERETRRQSAMAATREAEVTSQLRARQHARHSAEAARAEQNMLDEMAVAAALRGDLNRNE